MTARDMQAWTAVRMIGESASRTRSTDPKAMLDFLKGPDFALAAFKGQRLTLRDWNLQLRQPILLTDGRMIVSVSPQEGFLHQVSELDTLGDRPSRKQMQAQIADDAEDQDRTFSAATAWPASARNAARRWRLRPHRHPSERLHRLCLEREEQYHHRHRYRQIRGRNDDQGRSETTRHRIDQGWEIRSGRCRRRRHDTR